MIRYTDALGLVHRHSDGWHPMEPAEHANPAESDIERAILRGARIFRCTTCDTEIKVGDDDPGELKVDEQEL
jgi:hypothetical protein